MWIHILETPFNTFFTNAAWHNRQSEQFPNEELSLSFSKQKKFIKNWAHE